MLNYYFDREKKKWSVGRADVRCWMLDVSKRDQRLEVGGQLRTRRTERPQCNATPNMQRVLGARTSRGPRAELLCWGAVPVR
jgi:hypothetical protein